MLRSISVVAVVLVSAAVNAASPHKPKPEVEPHLTTAAGASASGSDVPTLAGQPRGLTPQGTASLVGTEGNLPTRGGGGVKLSCSLDETVVPDAMIACMPIADNSLARCFPAVDAIEVVAVRFGVESVSETLTVTVSLYDDTNGCPPTVADFVLLAKTTTVITSADNLTVVDVPLAVSVAYGTDLVVDLSYTTQVAGAWLGGNYEGQTCPWYILSNACGFPDYIDANDAAEFIGALIVSIDGWAGTDCGDGVCEGGEDCASCPEDCGPCPICGDGVVNQPSEECDGGDDAACPWECQADCTCPPPAGKTITIEIMVDYFPSETSWELVHKATGTIVASAGPLIDPQVLHTWIVWVTLEPSCYNWTIFDSFGDGICCDFGNGFYNVFHNGELVCSGGEFGESDTCSNIGDECDGGGGDVITCNVDKEIVDGNSIACYDSDCGCTTENQHARCFDGATFFPADTTVLRLDFGIEVAEQLAAPIEVIGTLYSIAVCDTVLEDVNLTVLGSGSITLVGDGSENLTMQTISFGAAIAVPAGTNVVAETAHGPGNLVYPGSNYLGQTCPVYIAADACGLPDLIDFGDIGHPPHLILNLHVGCTRDDQCDDGDDCTIDTCDSQNACVNEYQAQVYADICLPYDPPNGPQPNLDDILCLLDDFADGPAVDGCACNGFRKTTDLHPCPEDGGGDGSIGLDDILYMLDAFGGISPCDDPCP